MDNSLAKDRQELLARVYKELNIYSLLNRLKKELHWVEGAEFPDEVIIGVCQQYLKCKDLIRTEWAWFVRVMKEESRKYYAEKNIKENAEWKKEKTPQVLRDIMKAMR